MPDRKATSLLLFSLLLAAVLAACSPPRMSVEEAGRVAVSLTNATTTFTPPPRRIDDILDLLETEAAKPHGGGKVKAKILSRNVPDTDDKKRLAQFYYSRGMASWEMGWVNKAVTDLRQAYDLSLQTGYVDDSLAVALSKAEKGIGNQRQALEVLMRLRQSSRNGGMYNQLVNVLANLGEIDKAESIRQEAISVFARKHNPGPGIPRHLLDMQAYVLEGRGKWKEAEPYIRESIDIYEKQQGDSHPLEVQNHRFWLVNNLMMQERLLEAEVELRQLLRNAVERTGVRSSISSRSASAYVILLTAQNRLPEAEKMAQAVIRIQAANGEPSENRPLARTRITYGELLVARGDYAAATAQFDQALPAIQDSEFSFKGVYRDNPAVILALLRAGRLNEAAALLGPSLDEAMKRFGPAHFITAERRALQASLRYLSGDLPAALTGYKTAMPILLDRASSGQGDRLKDIRIRAYAEDAVDCLYQVRGTPLEAQAGIDATSLAFSLADAVKTGQGSGALTAGLVRAAAGDGELAALVRQEQDAAKEIDLLRTDLLEAVSANKGERVPEAEAELKARIISLEQARLALLDNIKKRFPKFAEFTAPRHMTPLMAAQALRPGETLLAYLSGPRALHVWAVNAKGTQWGRTALSHPDLAALTSRLRKSLDCQAETLGAIPPYDLTTAHTLYQALIAPVAPALSGSASLVICPDGPLAQIPFAALPTSAVQAKADPAELFSAYRSVPWLARQYAVSMMPSVAGVVIQRTLGNKTLLAAKPFIGFGDPIFSIAQSKDAGPPVLLAARGGHVALRGVRVTAKGGLDSAPASSGEEVLARLPDTADELRSIATALGADPTHDVYLGLNASKTNVRSLSLADRRVVAFATHALVPGDLDGLTEPALALSSSAVTGKPADGLLTAGEIFKLKLNADWVILSACNTGAADGSGADAVSGLGRAFFYAGAKAMLLSLWPVETTSARALTTTIFTQPATSRAEALRHSMLTLIDSPGLKDPTTNRIAASYAHPLFWAPFIIMGDGGE